MKDRAFAAALAACGVDRAMPAVPEPLTFVVHRVNGAPWPALYHGERKIGCKDAIVLEQRLDTLPNGAELRMKPAGELLRARWSLYQALNSLGALP